MANAPHTARVARPSWTRRALPALCLAAVLTVSGCSLPGLPGPTGAPAAAPVVEQAAAVEPVPEVQPATTPDPAPVAEPTPAPVVVANDLADGSASHALGAAGNQLVVDYWTTDDVSMWTSESSPIIQLSAKVAGSVEDKAVKITRFNARVDALNAVLANDTGDFAVGDPNSYSSAVLVPGHPGADSTRIVFTYDLLTETAPGTGIFTRQTVMDSLTLGYPANKTSPQK
ncbi:MAG: hypothetical protein ABWY04_17260 [Arthrobacter sp.]